MSLIALAAAIPLAAAAPAAASPDGIELFVRNTLKVSDFDRAEADLNADGRLETFIYVRDPDRCGTGGCNLYILSPDARGHRVVANVTVTRPPIVLLPTSTNGWRDVGVTVAGGGTREPYMARLRYEGGRYPSNPTVSPARPLGRATGEVLIGG